MTLEAVDKIAVLHYLTWTAFAFGQHGRLIGESWHIVVPVADG
ncbi:Uncharacterised protein [Salmonella enterica subsp. enterica]|uniref:Uncharacterized protein n=1 Tax=Salmonella enterica I TaxID=59201 RepID=A0A379WPJ4_SALET|nr:Uncharacterised protein [Salmonella enterica subsp. enterica]